MDKEIELLIKACEESSQGKVAAVLGISKTSVNLLLKGKYPKPDRMYKKILNQYDTVKNEIIGAECKTADLNELMKEIG